MYYYYIDIRKTFNNDCEYWVQVGMRMNPEDAMEILNKYGKRGYECRIQKCKNDRHCTMEKI